MAYSLFDDINVFDEGSHIAKRQAVAVAHKRVQDRVGAYLRLSKTAEERTARLDFVTDDIRQIVADVAEEYSVDHDKLLDAIEENLKGEGVTDIDGDLDNAPSAVGGKTAAEGTETDETCPTCNGSGYKNEHQDEGTCPTCHGAGSVAKTAGGHKPGCECGFCKNKGNLPGSKKDEGEEKVEGVVDDEEKADKDASEPEWSEKVKESSTRVAEAPRDGGGATKRVDLPKGKGDAVGYGASPKIDRKEWKPNALNADGNLPAIPEGIEMDGSPNPTVQQDLVDEMPDYEGDFLRDTQAVTTQQDLPSGEGNSFDTDKNISQENQMGSWTESENSPVTDKVFASASFEPLSKVQSAIEAFDGKE